MSPRNLRFYVFCILICLAQVIKCQVNHAAELNFTFDDHDFNETNQRVQTHPVGVSLVKDRFGNDNSALYLHGHANSYLSLGVSPLLKPHKGTVSLWVNLERIVHYGKGYPSNPIIETKNSENVDFYDAWTLYYDIDTKRLMVISTKDSTEAAAVNSIDTARFNQWQHLTFTFDDSHLDLYINGVLQHRSIKHFRTQYLATDSVVVGNTANKKNDRCMRGMVDDIMIFHRVLSEQEILALYHAPNPNETAHAASQTLKVGSILLGIFLCSYLLVWRRRASLQKEKKKFEMMNRFHELEIRTLKAQMNPHFIFNSLNSIRQFIMQKDHEKAELYLTKFAKLIRNLLETNEQESLSLRDEVDILNRYTEIEALRFGKQFNYEITVDPEVDAENTHIPHMMVQPFVENAIWHGLLLKEDDRNLTVKFKLVDSKTMSCTIDDNGIGRAANTNKKETFKKKSLALSYVRQRLEIMGKLNQCTYEVKVHDKYEAKGNSAGTAVTITMPVIQKKHYDHDHHH